MGQSASVEVRAVGEDAFDQIYPLLLDFKNTRMGKEDWRRMLFTYPWGNEPHRGFALFAEGVAVGFLGTVFCTRTIAGRSERFCNTSAWIVREQYRNASILLLKPLLALRDHTILQLTPNHTSYQIFQRLGFQELESEQLLLPPVPAAQKELLGLAGGSFSLSRDSMLRKLTGEELRIFRDLSSVPLTRHVLLSRGKGRCYLVATPSHRKGLTFADIQYIGDRDFFWSNRLLAHAAFFWAMGAAALALDSRFGEGYPCAFAKRRAAMRLYRPSRPEITPTMVDGLYSEWMYLRQ